MKENLLRVMPIRERVAPNSFDQILYIVLLWVAATIVITRFYETPLIRLDIVLGTGLIMIWVVWGIHYRLKQLPQERYRQNR